VQRLCNELVIYVACKKEFQDGDLVQKGREASGGKGATGDAVVPAGHGPICLALIKCEVQQCPAAQHHDKLARLLLSVFCGCTGFSLNKAMSLYYT
jgi:hypothetical protein